MNGFKELDYYLKKLEEEQNAHNENNNNLDRAIETLQKGIDAMSKALERQQEQPQEETPQEEEKEEIKEEEL